MPSQRRGQGHKVQSGGRKNESKADYSFEYSVMPFMMICRVFVGMSHRKCEEYVMGCWGREHKPEFIPIWKRVRKMMPALYWDDPFWMCWGTQCGWYLILLV